MISKRLRGDRATSARRGGRADARRPLLPLLAANPQPPGANATRSARSSWPFDAELVEQHLRVGLGPESYATPRYRVEGLLEVLLAIELDRQLLAAERGNQRVPGRRCRRGIAHVVEDGAPAADDVKEQDVVLERIRADTPITTVGLGAERPPACALSALISRRWGGLAGIAGILPSILQKQQ